MVRGQLSSSAIVGGTVMQGAIIRGAIFLGDNCPRTVSQASHISENTFSLVIFCFIDI